MDFSLFGPWTQKILPLPDGAVESYNFYLNIFLVNRVVTAI